MSAKVITRSITVFFVLPVILNPVRNVFIISNFFFHSAFPLWKFRQKNLKRHLSSSIRLSINKMIQSKWIHCISIEYTALACLIQYDWITRIFRWYLVFSCHQQQHCRREMKSHPWTLSYSIMTTRDCSTSDTSPYQPVWLYLQFHWQRVLVSVHVVHFQCGNQIRRTHSSYNIWFIRFKMWAIFDPSGRLSQFTKFFTDEVERRRWLMR